MKRTKAVGWVDGWIGLFFFFGRVKVAFSSRLGRCALFVSFFPFLYTEKKETSHQRSITITTADPHLFSALPLPFSSLLLLLLTIDPPQRIVMSQYPPYDATRHTFNSVQTSHSKGAAHSFPQSQGARPAPTSTNQFTAIANPLLYLPSRFKGDGSSQPRSFLYAVEIPIRKRPVPASLIPRTVSSTNEGDTGLMKTSLCQLLWRTARKRRKLNPY